MDQPVHPLTSEDSGQLAVLFFRALHALQNHCCTQNPTFLAFLTKALPSDRRRDRQILKTLIIVTWSAAEWLGRTLEWAEVAEEGQRKKLRNQ